MGCKTDMRRRWLGGIFLVIALLMLVAGETVLQHRLTPKGFLIFWAVCFVFTAAAMIVAFQDVMAQQRRARELQRELLEDTIREIVKKKQGQETGKAARPTEQPSRGQSTPSPDPSA